jgi:PPK2 family polyphosphate:nucleotide phosphotransferase
MLLKYRIPPDTKVNLNKWDPSADLPAGEKEKDIRKKTEDIINELESLQELLFASQGAKILVVLQGMDTSGKDGVIRRVFEGVNPQGVKVASFKVPTSEELSHDYLWRVHKQTPGSGEIVIFNRSHYEDVLVVRVHNLVPAERWERRFDQINQFEKMLADEGTTILKFFLHIDKDEQKERLQERLDTPTKRWKFNIGDLKERALWKDYTQAYEDVLSRTSTSWAPWYVIPSNRKWFRDYLISSILVDTLKSLNLKYPSAIENPESIKIE